MTSNIKNTDDFCRKEEIVRANIRRYLKINKLLQKDFAKIAGMSLGTLTGIINCNSKLTQDNIRKLETAMQVSAEELVSEDFLKEKLLAQKKVEKEAEIMAANIKSYLKANQISQQDFAVMVGIGNNVLHSILYSQYIPSKQEVEKIAKGMKVTVKDLLSNDFFRKEEEEAEKNLKLLREKIVKYLEENNIPKDKFAKQAGVSRYTIYKIINGETRPRKEIVKVINQVLNS